MTDRLGRALVVKAHYKSYWSFPGGIVDTGETPRQTAVRELGEEVGISLSADQLKFCFVVDRVSEIAQTYQFIFTSPLDGEASESLILDAQEITAAEWVAKEQILDTDRAYAQSVQLWARGFDDGYSEQVFGAGV